MTSSHQRSLKTLAVVIPARNEAAVIGQALTAVMQFLTTETTEVIVVDHGSTDDTANIAEAYGVTVRDGTHLSTVGSLRNFGVQVSTSPVIAFLDADILISREWAKRVVNLLETLRATAPPMVTGGWCTPPPDGSWIERTWFSEEQPSGSHLGSANLLVSRLTFDSLGGFAEVLRTGEDYDFCRRAVARGCQLEVDPELTVVHLGYPKTLSEFIRREVWHGVGDVQSIALLIRSRVAVAAVAHWCALITASMSLAVGSAWVALGSLGLSLGLSTTLVIRRYPGAWWHYWPGRTLLAFAYLTARGIAIVAKRRARSLREGG